MVHLLIPYKPLADHPDPLLDEFTYGDIESRGLKLKREVKKGDYIFLHTSVRGKKAITAYYVVSEVLAVSEAANDITIVAKYKNPHISRYIEYGNQYENDYIVFGDPIRSKIIHPLLLFDRNLASNLSLNIKFRDDYPDNQMISSSTRQWRTLTDDDVKILLLEIIKHEERALSSDVVLSTDEILEIREIDLENYLIKNMSWIGENVNLIGRQIRIRSGRLDLLFETDDELVVVEIKLNEIGRRAVNQIRSYMRDLREEFSKNVKGIIVCKDILPLFTEEFLKMKNIDFLFYGWKLHLFSPKRE